LAEIPESETALADVYNMPQFLFAAPKADKGAVFSLQSAVPSSLNRSPFRHRLPPIEALVLAYPVEFRDLFRNLPCPTELVDDLYAAPAFSDSGHC
jgi:hypothetical protein